MWAIFVCKLWFVIAAQRNSCVLWQAAEAYHSDDKCSYKTMKISKNGSSALNQLCLKVFHVIYKKTFSVSCYDIQNHVNVNMNWFSGYYGKLKRLMFISI